MKFKSTYLIVLMLLFMVFVFLDQNQTPVPIKILLGNPFHLGLSLIIIISMIGGALMAIGAIYLLNRRKALMNKKKDI